MDSNDEGGRELHYIDEDGQKQDEALWDEILGPDDQDTWDPSVDSERMTREDREPAPSSRLDKARALLSRVLGHG